MKLSKNGVKVMHHWESCKLTAYPDPGSKDGRPITIGWGHTGPEVKKGLVWTQAQADAAFLKDVERAERIVDKYVKVPLTQGQYDALVDSAYNIGPGKKGVKDGIMELFSGEPSTMLKLLNAGYYTGACKQLARWNKNDGKVMRGLVRRRASAMALWNGLDGVTAIKIGMSAA